MDSNLVAFGLAVAALLFAGGCVVVYAKLRPPSTHREPPQPPAASIESEPAEANATEQESGAPEHPDVVRPPEPEPPSRRFRVTNGSEVQQCLFVVFDWPALDTNRRLAKRLESFGARFDSKQQVYVIRDNRAGYRLTIANATPPGSMPPLHQGGDLPIVKGVSVLVHFVNKRRVAHSPETLIDFTLSVAEIGGKILDAERKEVTEADFERLRGASV